MEQKQNEAAEEEQTRYEDQQAMEQERMDERERAAEKLRAISSIAGEVTHNFNNILTPCPVVNHKGD